jgi:hypothetical protein
MGFASWQRLPRTTGLMPRTPRGRPSAKELCLARWWRATFRPDSVDVVVGSDGAGTLLRKGHLQEQMDRLPVSRWAQYGDLTVAQFLLLFRQALVTSL